MENRIRELAKLKNLKISQLIRDTGLSKSYLYDLISNNSVPSLNNARKIADSLNVKVEDVFPARKDSL